MPADKLMKTCLGNACPSAAVSLTLAEENQIPEYYYANNKRGKPVSPAVSSQ